ncbi:MAG: hypothetical protein Q7J73_04815, partial [Dehalococcoidales bacterium]|nr:hypothetical protein [Dehalococcoidales bacterium]
EIEATTWGAGGNTSNLWTFNLSAGDPTLNWTQSGATLSLNFEALGYASASAFYAQAGTALLPSFTFNNDPNTGIYRIAADTLGFTTNGVERFRLNSSSGASVSYDLEVTGTASISALTLATSLADAYVADAITVTGGTIGANNISGLQTTTATLTIGDNCDAIINDASKWDVSTLGKADFLSASVSTNFEATGYASVSAYFGAGVNGAGDCNDSAETIRWTTTGLFSCGTLTGGDGITITADDFDFVSTELEALTWGAGGNASNIWTFNLSAGDPTLTWTQSGATLSLNFEALGYASASAFYAQAGTALLPSFTFNNDPNTGIYRIAADTLGFTTNGTERFRLTTTGASLAYDFEVVGGFASISGELNVKGGLEVAKSNAADVAYSRFGANATTHAGSITAANDLLINGDLEVDGSVAFDGFALFSNGASVQTNFEVTGDNRLGINSGGSTDTTLEVGGNASISGTLTVGSISQTNSSVSGNLEIGGFASASYFYAQPGTAASPSFSFGNDKDTGMFRSAINQLSFSTLGLERVTILSDGNVGINATGPEQKLEVGGNILASSSASSLLNLVANNESDANFSLKVTGTSGSVARFSILGSASTEFFTVASSGNVGIGTTAPTTKLDVIGNASISQNFEVGSAGTAYIGIGNAGVRITDDGDGAITFLGLGNGNDEDLTINLDDTANEIDFTTSTGVSRLDFNPFTGEFASLQIDTTSTGVSLDTDGDGMLIIAGTGAGQDEDLRFNFDDTANEVTVTTNTGVTRVLFSSINVSTSLNFEATGYASVSAYFGAGVNGAGDCNDGAETIRWTTTGLFSCGTLTGGTGVDITTDDFTFDSTEIEATTWGAGGNTSNLWTFNLSTGDPTLNWTQSGATLSLNFEALGYASASAFYAQAGTALLPSFTFNNDPNTGLYRVAADQLGFSTGGAQRFQITSTGVSSSVDFEVTGGFASISGELNLKGGLEVAKGAATDVAYSRFGTTEAGNALITAANDLLISGDLELDGKAFFDGTASVAGNFEVGTSDLFVNTTGIGVNTSDLSVALEVAGAASISGRLDLFSNASISGSFNISVADARAFVVKDAGGTAETIFSVDTTASATDAGIDITAGASQTGNLLNFYDSSSNLLTHFSATGGLVINKASSSAFVIQNGSGVSRFVIDSNVTTGTLASISATSLTTGTVMKFTVPASTSGGGSYLLVKDTAGNTYASLGYGGRLAIRRSFFSRGAATTDCTSAGTPSAGCIDYAENFPTQDVTIEAGDVVAIDTTSNSSEVVKANNSKFAIGVVSLNPGVLLRGSSVRVGTADSAESIEEDFNNGFRPIALAGRLPVKVTTEAGNIKVGDYLTISSVPGVAMKATQAGQVIGQALEAYSGSDVGKVLLFVNNTQYFGSLKDLGLSVNSTDPGFDEATLNWLSTAQSSSAMASVSSEFVVDQIIAKDKIISPNIITKDLSVEKISNRSGGDLTIQLEADQGITIGTMLNPAGITLDGFGNAIFAGQITADKIKANQIVGLEVLAGRVS